MPAWLWFVVALVAAGGGALLLFSDRSRSSDSSRGRRRWAEQKSWEFVESDPVLPGRWRYGAVHEGGQGRAVDLATGAVPGPGGRRLAHVFDHEQGGSVTSTVAAVRGVATVPVAVELRLPSAPLPDDAGLDSMGQVGQRYAFVANVREARPLVTAEVAEAADAVGDDVPLVWAEDTWVLASTEPGTGTERMQEILQSLVGLSVAVEEALDPRDPRRDEGVDGYDDAPGYDDAHPDRRADDPERSGDARDEVRRDRDPDGAADRRGHDDRDDQQVRDDRDDLDDYDDVEIDDIDPDRPGHEERDERPVPEARTGAGEGSRPGAPPTHRDHPADIPYDVERDLDESERNGPGWFGRGGSRSSRLR